MSVGMEASTCDGKARFDSWGDANKVARRYQRNKGARVLPYRCPYCRGYHVGYKSFSKPKHRRNK